MPYRWIEFYCEITTLDVSVSYPLPYTEFMTKYPSLCKFCFAENPINRGDTKRVEFFTTTLTDQSGKITYVHVRRNGDTAFVVGSSQPWNLMYYDVLRIVAEQRGDCFCCRHFIHELDALGCTADEDVRAVMPPYSIRTPSNPYPLSFAPHVNAVFQIFDGPAFTSIVQALWCEWRVLVIGDNVEVITECVHALSTFVYPMKWCGILIPILPVGMEEIACSPVPFLIGSHASQLPQLLQHPTESLMLVDSRVGVVSFHGDPPTTVPGVKILLDSLLKIDKLNMKTDDVVNALLSFSIGMLGGAGKCIDANTWNLSDIKSFASKENLAFLLKTLQHTQMFSLFSHECLTHVHDLTVFLDRARPLYDVSAVKSSSGWKRLLGGGGGRKQSVTPPSGRQTPPAQYSPSQSPVSMMMEIPRLSSAMCDLNSFKSIHSALCPYSSSCLIVSPLAPSRHSFIDSAQQQQQDSDDETMPPEVADFVSKNIFARAALSEMNKVPRSIDELFRPVPLVPKVPHRRPPLP
eukprot:PhF_6_TR12288/c0_g1_i1/m.19506/K20160/DENND1; DENN domain-containing protein 1